MCCVSSCLFFSALATSEEKTNQKLLQVSVFFSAAFLRMRKAGAGTDDPGSFSTQAVR